METFSMQVFLFGATLERTQQRLRVGEDASTQINPNDPHLRRTAEPLSKNPRGLSEEDRARRAAAQKGRLP